MWWKRVQEQAYSAYSRMKSFENKFLIKFSSQKKKKKEILTSRSQKICSILFRFNSKISIKKHIHIKCCLYNMLCKSIDLILRFFKSSIGS